MLLTGNMVQNLLAGNEVVNLAVGSAVIGQHVVHRTELHRSGLTERGIFDLHVHGLNGFQNFRIPRAGVLKPANPLCNGEVRVMGQLNLAGHILIELVAIPGVNFLALPRPLDQSLLRSAAFQNLGRTPSAIHKGKRKILSRTEAVLQPLLRSLHGTDVVFARKHNSFSFWYFFSALWIVTYCKG